MCFVIEGARPSGPEGGFILVKQNSPYRRAKPFHLDPIRLFEAFDADFGVTLDSQCTQILL